MIDLISRFPTVLLRRLLIVLTQIAHLTTYGKPQQRLVILVSERKKRCPFWKNLSSITRHRCENMPQKQY